MVDDQRNRDRQLHEANSKTVAVGTFLVLVILVLGAGFVFLLGKVLRWW